jgi:isocitrate/isopropylmalate dehydrogenase
MVMQLFGSVAGAESLVLAFHGPQESGAIGGFAPSVVMAEAPHGTAPRLAGKNVANPLAMILAGAALLSYVDDRRAANASRAIYEAAFEALHSGIATADLGGHATTTEFTDAVIESVRRKLDVWSTL